MRKKDGAGGLKYYVPAGAETAAPHAFLHSGGQGLTPLTIKEGSLEYQELLWPDGGSVRQATRGFVGLP